MRHFLIVPHMVATVIASYKDMIINGNGNGSEGESGLEYVNKVNRALLTTSINIVN
jgi:hypothetical protein